MNGKVDYLKCMHSLFRCLQEIGRHTLRNAKPFVNQLDSINIYCPNCRLAVSYRDFSRKQNGVQENFVLKAIKDHVQDIKVIKTVYKLTSI